MFALITWRQDNGNGQICYYPSSVTVQDDAGNFWIPVETNQPGTSAIRCAIWMAPAARQAGFVFVSPTGVQGAITVLIINVQANCPWYSVAAQVATYDNSATSITLSETPASGLFTLGMVSWDNNSGSVSVTSSGWTAIRSVSTDNGSDHAGDLQQNSYWATTSGTLTLAASGSPTMDWASVLITVHGVSDTLAFPYSLPLENWPVLITEIAAGPVLNANPLILSGASDWTASGGAVAAVTWPVWNPWPSYQALITESLALTPSGSATTASVASEQDAVLSAVQYNALAYVYSLAGYPGGTAQVFVHWFTSGGSSISTTVSSGVTLVPGTWTQLVLNATLFPPATAALAEVGVIITATTGNVPSSAVTYIGYCALTVADAYENNPPDEYTWTDVSARNYTYESIAIDRGIQYEQQSLEAGTLKLSLANYDASWTFGNTESAYWPNAGDTDVPIRMRAVWPGSLTPYYPMFSGYTDDIKFGWEEDDGTWYAYAQITASDAWSRLTQQLLGCAEQEVLEDSPGAYFTCSISGANLATGNVYPVQQVASALGAAGSATFSASAIALQGDPGVSCWEVSGLTAGDAGSFGYALAYFPPGGAGDLATGRFTVEFWFSPVSASSAQPTSPLVLCTCWSGRGPSWTVWLDNTNGIGNSFMYITVFDKGTGTGTTTAVGTITFLGATSAADTFMLAVQFSQTSLTVIVNPGGVTTENVVVSCNLGAYIGGFSWAGNAGPYYAQITGGTGPVSSPGFMNVALYGISLYPSFVPPARVACHYQAGIAAFLGETDTWRVARICGYSGFIPPLAMRVLDLPDGGAANTDIVTAATDTSGQVVSSYLTNIAASTLAAMFVDGAGALVYRRRLEWYDRAAPQWVSGESAPIPLNSNTLNQVPATAPWAAQNGATLTIGTATVNALFYPWSGLFSGNGSTPNPQIIYGDTGSTNGVPVTPGLWYQVSAWTYSPQGYGNGSTTGITLSLEYYTSGLSRILTATLGPVAMAAGSITFLAAGPFRPRPPRRGRSSSSRPPAPRRRPRVSTSLT